jgi:microcystin-dependent protein
MAEPFIGEIMIFGGNFAPMGWMMCQGQTLAIQPYQALFALIGTTYGGNGTSNFQLPDLRGRAPIGFGQGTGLSNHALGLAGVGGAENVTLAITQMPIHNHTFTSTGASATVAASANPGTSGTPGGNYLANATDSQSGASLNFIQPSGAGTTGNIAGVTVNIPSGAIAVSGGGQPHSVMQPYLPVNYIIAYNGIFPTRE